MKKNLDRKLKLSKETLRALAVLDLEGIRGGLTTFASVSCATDLTCESCIARCSVITCDCY